MNLLSLVKSARANSPLDFPSLFKALGVSVDLQEIPPEQWPEAFQRAARSTLKIGASVVHLKGTMQDGSTMEAIMITAPAQVTERVTKNPKKPLDMPPAYL